MSLRQIKWLILLIPTIAIGLWEYVRHSFLIPYISMELGNLLAPVIVLIVTTAFLLPLFRRMDKIQEALKRERAAKAVLEERERIARELHDGIAQSLFFMSVQMDHMEGRHDDSSVRLLRKTVHEANRYVRQAITNLRAEPGEGWSDEPWSDSIRSHIRQFESETGIIVTFDWSLPDDVLQPKEKVELLAAIREALINVKKHSHASRAKVSGMRDEQGWQVYVEDNGAGFDGKDVFAYDKYGLQMIREKAALLQWRFRFERIGGHTRLEIRKELAG